MATINKIPNCPPLRFPDFNDDWTQTTLGEIAGLVQTRRKATTRYLSVESFLPNFGGVQFAHNETNNSGVAFEVDDVLMSNIRPYLRKVWRSNCSGACSSDVLVFRCGTQVISQFLYSIIANQAFIDHTMQGAKGVKMPRGDKQQMKSYPISLPSLAEQKKIADFLSLIDERIQSCSEAIKELKTQKAGLLNQLFSQKLRFPNFDDEWTQCFVSDFGQVVTGSTPPTSDSCNYDASDYLWASPSDLGQTKYIRKTKTMLSSKGFSLTRSLPLGSVLVSCIGIIGKVGVAVTEMSTNQQINAIIPNQSKVNSEYVYYAILNKSLAYSRLSATQVVPILSKREFERMRNQYPSLAEQKKIADFLSLIDERIEVEELLLKKYEEQKKYLLRNMFV